MGELLHNEMSAAMPDLAPPVELVDLGEYV
jgi:hypothetical protein